MNDPAPSSQPSHAAESPQHGPSIARSTLINVAGALLPAGLLLVTVPLYLHRIGEARYGVLAIVWLLLGYFAVFDLGFGRAVANRMATLYNAQPAERQQVFWTGLLISVATGLMGGLLLYLMGDWLFASVFSAPPMLRLEVEQAMPWLLLALPLIIVISLLAGALEGRQAFLALNVGQMAGTLGYQIFPLVVAYSGKVSLAYLIPAAIAGRFLSAIVLFYGCYRSVPLTLRPSVSGKLIKPLLGYGGWITVTGVVGPLLTVFDRFLIAAKLGVIAVTSYTVPYNLVLYFSVLPASLQTALFPRFAMVEQASAKQLLRQATLTIAAILTPVIAMAEFLIKPFLLLWIGQPLASHAAPVGQILLLGIWVNSLAFVPFSYLQASGRPDIPAKLHVLELVPFVLLLWVLIVQFGVVGAAWAWVIRVLADALLLFWFARGMDILRDMLFGSLLLLASFVSVWYLPMSLGIPYAVLTFVLVVAVGLWCYRIAPRELTDVVGNFEHRVKNYLSKECKKA
ncbi:flippase [Acidithiobacillus sp. IBUN Pt1247-S3]|uniref:flippase n=1 Tax=Acidithiobacillus sp. IBUN Pt1247-S3 TaxID=3166642 RepID=UPI0034E4022F